jgi:hypothetical protein
LGAGNQNSLISPTAVFGAATYEVAVIFLGCHFERGNIPVSLAVILSAAKNLSVTNGFRPDSAPRLCVTPDRKIASTLPAPTRRIFTHKVK